MSVDVSYQGVSIARSATVRPDGDAAFVELDAPLPVGTWLEVKTGGVTVRARVFRVNEGARPGMLLRFSDGKTLPAEAFSEPRSEKTVQVDMQAMIGNEPNAPIATMESGPKGAVIEADADKREPAPEITAEDNRQTIQMPIVVMEAAPEDETPSDEESNGGKDDGGGGRRKKKKPRKTVIGH